MEKPAPKPAPKPVEQPTLPKPTESPAPKPPESDPFIRLPKAVDLPILGKEGGEQPFLIGNIATGPKSGWQLWLLGGDNAVRNNRQANRQFILKAKDTDQANANWLVQLEEESSGSEPQRSDVARFWREGDALKFQWIPGTAENPANYLRNCILEVWAEGKSTFLPLVATKLAEPIVIDLQKGVAKVNIPADYVPDSSRLRLQVLKIEGREGYKLEPSGPVDLKTPIVLSYLRKDRDGNEPDKIEFQIKCIAKNTGFAVDLNGALVSTQPKGPRARLAAVFKPVGPEAVEKERKTISADKAAKEAALKAAKNNQEKAAILAQLHDIDRSLWYVEFFAAVHAKAKIHYCIYMDAGERKTILVTTLR
jgi:hypothetical protein